MTWSGMNSNGIVVFGVESNANQPRYRNSQGEPVPTTSNCLVTKLGSFARLTQRDLACLASLQSVTMVVEGGRELLRQGEQGQFAYILQSGWGSSFKILQNGGKQVITFPVPGDFVCLRSVLLRTSDHSCSAITDALVSRIEIAQMLCVFNEFPLLGSAILWATSRDEAITVEHLANIGRRTVIERTAHFVLELEDRLKLVGLTNDAGFDCPLTQYDLADALGLSAIHINRVLRELREINLMTFQDHKILIHDRAALKELAGYEDVDGGVALLGGDADPASG